MKLLPVCVKMQSLMVICSMQEWFMAQDLRHSGAARFIMLNRKALMNYINNSSSNRKHAVRNLKCMPGKQPKYNAFKFYFKKRLHLIEGGVLAYMCQPVICSSLLFFTSIMQINKNSFIHFLLFATRSIRLFSETLKPISLISC